MWKKYFLPALLSVSLLSACSGSAPADAPGEAPKAPAASAETAADTAEKPAKDASQPEASPSGSVDGMDPALFGDWEFMCANSSSSDSDSSYFYMAADEPMSGTISIYEEDAKAYADFESQNYESVERSYHLPVAIEDGALYPDCPNKKWHAVISSPKSDKAYRVTLIGDNELVWYQEDSFDSEDGSSWTNYETQTFVRKGSPEANDPDRYRYTNTVTVSTAKELLDAIADNTRIYLKDGLYNLTEVSGGTTNRKVFAEVDKLSPNLDTINVQIRDVSDLCIEAEEGATAEICITDPYSPVLSLYNCSRVNLRGLTMGHHVEPGYCSGSVLDLYQSYHTSVTGCRLYGSGTYGIEGNGSYGLTVKDTEIYDCTYGITSLREMSDIHFENCNMHDNTELAMVDLSQCYDVEFKGCEFTHNIAKTGYNGASAFIETNGGGSVSFKDCRFDRNEYAGFKSSSDGSDGSVETENCTFNDKELGFG
ncbi:MAG: right-handed parallel beta-helix repeat-containing protein [Lachnospiraceae bacterium]|nr:right-handed parallel beta-helix repeat-containing protein [Lachnospiraceae bacterium]